MTIKTKRLTANIGIASVILMAKDAHKTANLTKKHRQPIKMITPLAFLWKSQCICRIPFESISDIAYTLQLIFFMLGCLRLFWATLV
jgi:hypothetical protein